MRSLHLSRHLLTLCATTACSAVLVGCAASGSTLSLLSVVLPVGSAPPPPPPPQTPISVSGNAMTFHSISPWIEVTGKQDPTFCTTLRRQHDDYFLVVKDPSPNHVDLHGGDFTVVIRSHSLDPAHNHQTGSTAGKEGVRMVGRRSGTCGSEIDAETVTISTFHDNPLKKRSVVGFYANDGGGIEGYPYRKRYHNTAVHKDYDCSKDGDACESLAWISITGSDFQPCTPPDCSVSIYTP